ncbi:MAG: hypothetical protein V1722_03410 [Candidatus Micrarchaeota archaeon]
MAKEIIATAPCKVILTGEHAVVHGSPALAISIEPFSSVHFLEEQGALGFVIKQKGADVVLNEKCEVQSGNDWKWYSEVIDLLKKLIKETGFKPRAKIVIEIKADFPKGVGGSSSIAAAFIIAFYKFAGALLTSEKLFEDVQFLDAIAHGGSASGIDAMTVIGGPMKLVRTVEQNNCVKWNFYLQKVELPQGTTLLVIDTSRGGKRAATGEMTALFAKNMSFVNSDGSTKKLFELTATDKAKLVPFTEIFEKIMAELKPNGDAIVLGALMNANHALLEKMQMSSQGIEEARKICIANKVYGVKLTGGGGEGGAVIALINKNNAVKIINELEKHGFKAFEAKTTKGAFQ